MDMIDRVTTIGSALSSNLDSMTQAERDKYRDFLQSELRKLDEQAARNAAKEKVDVQ
jgi:hypothetical protein